MKAYLVNPVKQTIETITFDGTIAALAKHYPYSVRESLVMNFGHDGDSILCMDPRIVEVMISIGGIERAKEFGAFAYMCEKCDEAHHIFGTAIICQKDPTSSKESGLRFKNPNISFEDLEDEIAWGTIQEEKAGKNIKEVDNHEEVPMDAKSLVETQLELARLSTKH